MLSSVLSSPRAIAVNVLIMRAFVQLRPAEGHYAELRQDLVDLARKVQGHDELLSALEALASPTTPSRPMGFRAPSPPIPDL
jgi:hypothetical protein